MIPTIILVILIVMACVIYFTMNAPVGKIQRQNYLEAMAHLFEGKVEPVLGAEHSCRITFNYRGQECLYEEVEVETSKGTTHFGYLKIKTPSKLNLSFTERTRTQIRSNAQSLEELAASMWGSTSEQVKLPKSLQDFHVYTNNPVVANKFMSNEKVLKVFNAYKNRDARGHPLMSLQVVEGVIGLEFHPTGELKPALFELQHNVTAAETYLRELIVLAENLKIIEQETKDYGTP